MKIEKNDFLVINLPTDKGKDKFYFVQTIDVGRQLVGVVADISRATRDTQTNLTFKASDVVSNLGNNPHAGSVYGQKAEPWLEREPVPIWGEVNYFRHLDDREHTTLLKNLRASGREIQRLGLADSLPLRIDVRPKRGKWAGSYLCGGERKLDIVTYHPGSLTEDMDYVIWHEDGHRIWYRMMPAAIMARWVKLYHSAVTLSDYELERIREMRKQFSRARLSFKDFRNTLEEDDELDLFDDICSWITGCHSIKLVHADLLIANDIEMVAELWPEKELDCQNQDVIVSDYGLISPEEFFADAWSFHYTGKEIPDRVRKAVERTYKGITR